MIVKTCKLESKEEVKRIEWNFNQFDFICSAKIIDYPFLLELLMLNSI